MALILDPRVIVIPTFRFEKDGTFVVDGAVERPQPDEFFECRGIKLKPVLRSAPWRKSTEAVVIAFGSEEKSVTFVSSTSEEFPLFWRCELLDGYGRSATEADYQGLWQLRKFDRLAYFSFAQKPLSLALRTEGRLLEILVYLLFFEANETSAGAIRERLEKQLLKELVAKYWQELTTKVAADLRGRSLAKELSAKFPAAAAVFEYLD